MSGMKFEKEIFMKYLIEREASEATKKKYMTDVTTFYSYAAEAEEIDKELLLAYREWLMQHYAVSSVNSMLVALNQYLLAVGLGKWKLRRVRVQGCNSKMMERELQKSDYIRSGTIKNICCNRLVLCAGCDFSTESVLSADRKGTVLF